jgi:hypothetical protein
MLYDKAKTGKLFSAHDWPPTAIFELYSQSLPSERRAGGHAALALRTLDILLQVLGR